MNEATIRQWYDVFKDNNELVEIRILDPETRKTYSGYFTNIEDILREIKRYDKCNIYFSLNVINPACYGREQKDKISTRPKSTTSDTDIIARKWCLIDIDCEKPSDTNSTDEEKEAAKQVVNSVYKFLRDEGFEPPVICDSANGWHLLYKQAMRATPENTEIMKRFLQVLDMYFSTDKVKIDVSTFNNSRICKLYGTVSRKGSDTIDRPQRLSGFVRVPREVRVTPNEYFAKVASYLPQPEKKDKYNNYGASSFDLDEFLRKHNIEVDKVIEDRDYTKYILKNCPFNSSHHAPDSAVFKMRDGSFGFKCLHASDSRYTFRDFRSHFEPDAYSRERSYSPHRSFKPYRGEKLQLELQETEAIKGNVWQTFGEIEDEDRSKIVSIPSGITQLDAECCGFDKPSLNIWSGNNGSAKSTLLNQIAINAVNQGFKVAIYSGELRGQRLKRWVVMQAAGKAHNRKSIYNSYDYYTPDSIKEHVVSWLSDKLYVYNTKYSHSMEQVCLEVETLVREKQIDMLIMDNLSCMDIAELDFGVNEQQKTAVKLLLRLTTKLGIATHLVVHPKKAEGFLRKNDVSGAKALTDLADSVFFCHRWNQDTQKAAKEFLPEPVFYDLNTCGTTNIVEVIKHREFGEAEGHIYKLYYEPESRRLKNSVAENVIYGWYEQPSQSVIFDGSGEFDIPAEDNAWRDMYNFDGDESPF
jgi:KaiC/GvpD/RAD55 family RecA-like ATPase